MRTKRYHLYAGYYENVISAKTLRAPLMRQGTYDTLCEAVKEAALYNDHLVIDKALAQEAEALPLCHDIPYTTADCSAYYLENGLSELTLDNLHRRLNTLPIQEHFDNLAEYISIRSGMALVPVTKVIRKMSYAQLAPLIASLPRTYART